MTNRLVKGVKKIVGRLADIVFVKKCAACGELLEYDRESKLCEDCFSEWEIEKMIVCPRCKETQVECRCGFG